MTIKELSDNIKDNTKFLVICSYIQFVCTLPLLLKHLLFIPIIIFSALLIYQCRQIKKRMSDYESNIDNDELYIAEDSLDEAGKNVYYANCLSVVLLFSLLPIAGVLIHKYPIYGYLFVTSIVYFIFLYLLNDMEKSIKSLILSIQMYRDSQEGRHGQSYYIY